MYIRVPRKEKQNKFKSTREKGFEKLKLLFLGNEKTFSYFWAWKIHFFKFFINTQKFLEIIFDFFKTKNKTECKELRALFLNKNDDGVRLCQQQRHEIKYQRWTKQAVKAAPSTTTTCQKIKVEKVVFRLHWFFGMTVYWREEKLWWWMFDYPLRLASWGGCLNTGFVITGNLT